MTIIEDRIRHDGGTHSVEIELDGDQAVISFGASFTLRVDEGNLMKLRALFKTAGTQLAIERRDSSDVQSHDLFELDGSELVQISEEQFASSAEADMIQHGIDASEMMKGTTGGGVWNPNDPTNW